MNELEVKKQLLKSKVMAKFSHYVSGNLYYTVELDEGVFQFPITTIEDDWEWQTCDSGDKEEVQVTRPSSDLGTTSFNAEMRGSELNRWIAKAIKSGEFIKVSE